jgi:hypothetical protein
MGKVFRSLSMSLDGYVAGPNDAIKHSTTGWSAVTPPAATATA